MRRKMPLTMKINELENAVTDIPAGLIACRLGGRQLHISSMAENGICLRLASEQDVRGRLELCFRGMDGSREYISVDNYQTGPAHRDDCGVLVRLFFSDADYVSQFRRSMALYADYVRAFAEGEVQQLADYPAHLDGDFAQTRTPLQLHLPPDREICVSLHDPELYALYLNHGPGDFLQSYAAEKRVSGIEKIHRLYIGNGFCRQLFPDEECLRRLLEKAGKEGLAVTLVTAPDPRLPEQLPAAYSGEILANDWGLLHRLQKFPRIEPVLGTLLNKRRKDPRMHFKPDLNPDLLRETAINSPEYRDFLRSLGVQRLEFERCGYDYQLPGGKCSLHLPFYQTNTSVYCPTRALCEHGDRARQSDDAACPRYCMNNGLRYPAHLKMFARWNSLFALDDREMDGFPGFDRIVINL